MIDEAVVDLWQWVEGKAGERVIGKVPERQPGKGETWVPKYASIGDILDEYDGPIAPDAPAVDTADLDALIAELEAQASTDF